MVLRRRSRGRSVSSHKGCDSSEDKSPASMMKTAPLAAVEPWSRGAVLSIEFGLMGVVNCAGGDRGMWIIIWLAPVARSWSRGWSPDFEREAVRD